MSWPSIWQTQNQPQTAATATAAPEAQTPAMNMYQMTPEQQQQYALQQQNWQQWQIYQTQLAQWQAQYGEQYQQMQNKLMGATNVMPTNVMPTNIMPTNVMPSVIPNAYMSAPPPPPVDHQPPPPPPPQQQTAENTQTYAAPPTLHIQNSALNPPLNEDQSNNIYKLNDTLNAIQANQEQSSNTFMNQNAHYEQQMPSKSAHYDQQNSSKSAHIPNKGAYGDQQSNSQQNQDGYRRNNRNNNNNRWNNGNNNASNNNSSNRNNRMFGGNNFNNRNAFDRDDKRDDRRDPFHDERRDNYRDEPRIEEQPQYTVDEYSNEEKSQEEIAFDIQYRKWEDSFMEWKRNNANHPDRSQYNDFVRKMELCRQQLLQKREGLRKKRLDSQRDPQAAEANQSEAPSKPIADKKESENVVATEPSVDLAQESSSAQLFANRSDSEAGIPGLDLVSEEKKPKTDPNIVAHVNNILGNPEIQSLLSNIQKQQNDPAQPAQAQAPPPLDIHRSNENAPQKNTFNRTDNVGRFNQQMTVPPPGLNTFNRSDNVPRFGGNQNMGMSGPGLDTFSRMDNVGRFGGNQNMDPSQSGRNAFNRPDNIGRFGENQNMDPSQPGRNAFNRPPDNGGRFGGNQNMDPPQSGPNVFNRPPDNGGRFDRNQPTDSSQRNPFRQNKRDDYEQSDQYVDEFAQNPKRGRFWNENPTNDFSPFDHMNRDRGNFSQQLPGNQGNQGEVAGPAFTTNNRNHRFNRDMDSFNSANRNFNSPQNDFEEFRPMQIIDYQNRGQGQSQGQGAPNFGNRPPISGSSNLNQINDFYPRKVVEYDHKTKIHPFNWFCPIIQIDYNHTSEGISLHSHPPPKRIERLAYVERPYWNRQSKWSQNQMERKERLPYGQAQNQHQYQPKYDNQQNVSNQPMNENQMNRTNQPEKSWIKNNRDRGNPQNVPNYNRPAEPMNTPPPKKDMRMQPNTSSTYHQKDKEKKVEPPCARFNLKHLLFPPGRETRPKKIVILMRGIPGSGKSYVSKLIKDKEQEMGGSARILSIDDYFMTETDADTAPGQKTFSEQMAYEFDPKMEETYTQYLIKSYKKTLSDNLFNCIIVDCNNTTLKHLSEFYTIAKMNFFTPYICELPLDVEKCLKNNIHNRTEGDIRKAADEWIRTPSSYTLLDYDCLFAGADNMDMEEISDADEEKDEQGDSLDAISEEENTNADKDLDELSGEDDTVNEFGIFKSKWDNDTTENKLARLDGISKPIKHTTIEDYLQMDGWEPPPTSTNGKKRVRWADIEEKREHDKQRAIGFVVGQTNWDNLIDQPRDHKTALTKVKYIEKIKKN